MNPRFIIQILILVMPLIASYPSDYEPDYEIVNIDGEVPVHLIKRSLHSDFGTTLTGIEKITKRSLKADTSPLFDMERISKRSIDDEDDGDREKRWAFLPKFARRRQRRSIIDEGVEDEENEDREKRWAFLPKFARRRQRRAVVSDENSDAKRIKRFVFRPNFHRRQRRDTNHDHDDDLEAVSGIFIPSFH